MKDFNEQAEEAWKKKILARFPQIKPNSKEAEKVLVDAGKKKQICVVEKELRTEIVELYNCHLRWHPATHLPVFSQEDVAKIDPQEVWRDQTAEMHLACKNAGQAWAWEYLWTNWYRPSRWVIWARAIYPEVPIINSNSIVESLWSTLKRHYLRKHSRAKLEFLIDIIMNQHLTNLRIRIHHYRSLKERTVWYVRLTHNSL